MECFYDSINLHQPESETMRENSNLKQALLQTTLELESTRLVANQEIKKLELQSLHLAHLLQVTTRERDHLLSLLSVNNNIHEASPQMMTPSPTSSSSEVEEVPPSALPEKGKLMKAVMAAGPLLSTLMVAGTLPEWKHPPPAMEVIPAVEIGKRKRVESNFTSRSSSPSW